MAFTAHRELSAHTEKMGERSHASLSENLHLAGYDTRSASCRPSESKFVDGVRNDLNTLIDKAGLSPEQKKDAEKYVDAMVPKCGSSAGDGENRAKDIEAKYGHDKNMSKLLKNMRESAQLSFD